MCRMEMTGETMREGRIWRWKKTSRLLEMRQESSLGKRWKSPEGDREKREIHSEIGETKSEQDTHSPREKERELERERGSKVLEDLEGAPLL